ncbi:hypothetical protein COLU111180_15005 [Cohnella lubricantis]|uniref:Uncharacterized protein n=1 Tax=Cohnella lubricantis TaxID=2163172 RepID=A0A841TF19_9BACL|nr:hypothetical protein [Cohnella lubricantis]MBB6677888.1 hypothetical protein [Cohnella lubricantis]MBP2119070.1 multidrug resistance efflux pump [Cohnella lubricantis]
MPESLSVWSERLQQARSRIEEMHKRKRQLEQVEAEVKKQREIARNCLSRSEMEQADVEELNKLSLSRVWHRITGKLEERIGVEEREAAEAQLKYDSAQAALQALEQEKAETSRLYGEVMNAEAEYERLLKEKAEWIGLHDPGTAARLEELTEEIGLLLARLRETEEAIRAGNRASERLTAASEKLRSARNWGTYDMLGGGMISTHIKHNRIEEARQIMHEAQHALRMFEKELADLNWRSGAGEVEIGGFLSFADYFFDGFLTDWIVQGRINEALDKVEQGSQEVTLQLRRLSGESASLNGQIGGKRNEHKALVEGA